MTDPILKVENARLGYGDLTAVWDASLSVYAGKTTAMLGRNGAGKSTLLSGIAGLLPLREGKILLNGEDVSSLPPYARTKMGISLVQEGKRVFRNMTVRENLEIGTFARRRTRADSSVQDILDRFPRLRPRLSEKAGALSGGQQQMLAIAQAMLSGPKLLLLDEPTSGLAPVVVDEVMQTIVDLKSDGLAIVLVEQIVSNVLSGISDDVIVVDQGRVVLSSPAGLLTESQLSSAAKLV